MKPYIILMLFALVALFSGNAEARLFRSRAVTRQTQSVRVVRQPVRRMLSPAPAAKAVCINGQCSR